MTITARNIPPFSRNSLGPVSRQGRNQANGPNNNRPFRTGNTDRFPHGVLFTFDATSAISYLHLAH